MTEAEPSRIGTQPMRVLVVCIGNVCRSALAERLLLARAEQAGVGISVESAGVRAVTGSAMDPSAADELVRLGGSPADFVARPLTGSMIEEADLVLTATLDVRSMVLNHVPSALRRTFTIREFAALADHATDIDPADLVSWAAGKRSRAGGHDLDVVDPIGRSLDVHRDTANQISAAVDVIVTALRTDHENG